MLKPHLGAGGVNVINVEHLARGRGIELVQIHEPAPPPGSSATCSASASTPRTATPTASSAPSTPTACRACSASTTSPWTWCPRGRWCLILNRDQPGVIGFVGTTFGDAGVNIADMVISRAVAADGSATALMLIKTDSEPTADLVEKLRAKENILRVRSAALPPRG